ncbi:MAG: S1 RNA-binding domain-containing protein [Methanosarcinales archaeon]|nr:S1 RNA-binding domain-containing protein [Methanosarcinales archaeon]
MGKTIVVPGDILSDNIKMSGSGTYVRDGEVCAAVYGILNAGDRYISVIPLAGKYIPHANDRVIGIVTEVAYSNWIVDINAPYEGVLHISQYPQRIDVENMSRYLKVGDCILTMVKDVDAGMRVELSFRDRENRRLDDGRIITIDPTKMPRVIGRSGSMIRLLKNEIGCGMFVGQNGRIWINGNDDRIDLAIQTVKYIEDYAHTPGLTERVQAFLKAKQKTRYGRTHESAESAEHVESAENTEGTDEVRNGNE